MRVSIGRCRKAEWKRDTAECGTAGVAAFIKKTGRAKGQSVIPTVLLHVLRILSGPKSGSFFHQTEQALVLNPFFIKMLFKVLLLYAQGGEKLRQIVPVKHFSVFRTLKPIFCISFCTIIRYNIIILRIQPAARRRVFLRHYAPFRCQKTGCSVWASAKAPLPVPPCIPVWKYPCHGNSLLKSSVKSLPITPIEIWLTFQYFSVLEGIRSVWVRRAAKAFAGGQRAIFVPILLGLIYSALPLGYGCMAIRLLVLNYTGDIKKKIGAEKEESGGRK